MKAFIKLTILFAISVCSYSQEGSIPYQLPSKEVADILFVNRLPKANTSPNGKYIIYQHYDYHKNIRELAEPELRLAGMRINPANNAQSRITLIQKLSFQIVGESFSRDFIDLPQKALFGNVTWSPDQTKIAFCSYFSDRVELWIAEILTGKAKRLGKTMLNVVFDDPFEWLSDSKSLVCSVVPAGRGEIAVSEKIEPFVQENSVETKASRTYTDLIKSIKDEELFEYYTSSEIIKIDLAGKQTLLLNRGIYKYFSSSPDGKYLLTKEILKPFSYAVPYNRFGFQVRIHDTKGRKIKDFDSIPTQDNIPIGRDAVSMYPRNHGWVESHPASVYWVEAQDKGNPKENVEIRDKVLMQNAPFDDLPIKIADCNLRYNNIIWGTENIAFLYETFNKTKKYRISALDFKNTTTIFEGSVEDIYNLPGDPLTKRNTMGRSTLLVEGDSLVFLSGYGASKIGIFPFLKEFNFRKKQSNTLWQSENPYFETVIDILDTKNLKILTSRESADQNPNYFITNLREKTKQQLTQQTHPYADIFKNIEKRSVSFRRADSVSLNGTIFLPKNLKKGEKLPVILWSYPEDFQNAESASMNTVSPNMFIYLSSLPPIAMVADGYIVACISMPIVGKKNIPANDSYIEQLKANSLLIVEELSKMPEFDTKRMAVCGHSYGAFMVANLLTHTNYFKTGIALSGAYNRTLTPFGFQREERTYWQNPNLYDAMSPFQNADKMKYPILLVHGGADNNQGTFILQSERYFQALKGLGANVRFVTLPYESHNYVAKESLLHLYWEMGKWLDKYLHDTKTALNSHSK